MQMRQILKTYQTKLTNLSASNKSLLQLRAYKQTDLDLHELNFLNSEASIKIVEKLLLKKTVSICLVDDPRSEHNNNISKRVQQIGNRAKFIQNERGSEDLYLAYPFVQGKLKNAFPIRCPLFFIPVSLSNVRNHWQLSPKGDIPIKFNRSFLLAHAYYHETKLDRSLDEAELQDLDYEDLKSFLLRLYELLKESQIELNFNTDLFEEQLRFFSPYKKTDFENDHKDGILKLQPHAVLGIYPQAGSNLFSDYGNIIEKYTHESLETYFATKVAEAVKNKEESFFSPFAIDASQEEAVKLLRSGKSIVVQGPPGTGKSQLIAQVIADYLANGKKILLACDKRVALDVVYNRLKTIALDKHIGLVHDYNTDRKMLYGKISHYLENLEHIQHQNNRYDTIALERDFLQTSRRITQLEELLNGLKKALFDEQPYGVSAKYLYLNAFKAKASTVYNEQIETALEACKNWDFNSFQLFSGKLKYWLPKACIFEDPSFLLKDRLSFKGLTQASIQPILGTFKEKNALITHTETETKRILGQGLTLLHLEALKDHIPTCISLSKMQATEAMGKTFLKYVTLKVRRERIDRFYESATTLLTKGIVDQRNINILQRHKELLTLAYETLNKKMGRLRYHFSYAHKKELSNILPQYQTQLDKDKVYILLQKVTNTITLVEASTNLKKGGILQNDEDWEHQHALEDWYELQIKACEAVELFKTLPAELFQHVLHQPYHELLKSFHDIARLYNEAKDKLVKFRKHLSESQINTTHDEQALSEHFMRHFDELCEFDTLSHDFDNTEKNLAQVALQLPTKDIDETLQELQNLVYNRWIFVLEQKYPILTSVSTGYVQRLEDELREALQHKQELSAQIVPLKTSEQSYKNLEYNRLGNRTTFRDLLHETTKKKKIKPIRQLFEAHMEEVLQIIPCWMASPETVSAIFPNMEVFDLVIFDEASQCFTEEAIPALFRGKQVLVSGDSKQLPPSDLYKPRWEEEEEHIDEQTNSFLDLACRYLPQTMLQEHYRSHAYELIHFSNEKFYHNKLRLIPDLAHFNSSVRALQYVKVFGIWQQQSNYLEAVECVRLVKDYLHRYPHKSLGIITFNFKQQELIEELLLNDSIKENYVIPDSLFVKNIENVQGDERDVIICSIAYAPNEDGKMVSSFGSLALAGGENRLNVAITRAKEKMYIVASILPQQLQTENSKNPGPALLKEYLTYAWSLDQQKVDHPYLPQDSNPRSQQYLSTKMATTKQLQNVGFADLITFQNGKAHTAVITDDNLYYQSKGAKEIHGYVPNTLLAKNWNVEKCYSRQYFEGKITHERNPPRV